MPVQSGSHGATVATSVSSIRQRRAREAGIDESSLLRASNSSSSQLHAENLQVGAQGPHLEWTVPRYLASRDPATYGVGLTFMRRTFGLCVTCFGLTCCMTGGLLMLWGHGMEKLVFTDVCTRYTHWSCTQWAVDGVLVLLIIPLKFCYGMMHGWTNPMLCLLAVFQSANLALLGCFSRSFAPVATQTFVTFWVALVTIWLTCICRERALRAHLLRVTLAARSKDAGAAGAIGGVYFGNSRQTRTGLVVQKPPDDDCCYEVGCCDWVGSDGLWSGWRDGWARLALYGAVSVTICNFLLMLLKLWLDEPSAFVGVRAILSLLTIVVKHRSTAQSNLVCACARPCLLSQDDGSGSDASWNPDDWPDDPNANAESDEMFSHEGKWRLVELLMGAPGLSLNAKRALHFCRRTRLPSAVFNFCCLHRLLGLPSSVVIVISVLDNGKVFVAAQLLTLFTVLEAKGAAKYCAPSEHRLAALFIW